MSPAKYLVGDVFDQLATLEPGSVDMALTSPPFWKLRSYLDPDDPAKQYEMGSEPTPGAFVDRLLDVVEALDRVLAPHGSIAIELGDSMAGSGGAGGDYNPDGLRDGQPRFNGTSRHQGTPLDKSHCLIPEIFRFSLVYGFNPLTGRRTPQWRARNIVQWCRPNPPVGALADSFRRATSDLLVACHARDRYFDLDAVRQANPRSDEMCHTSDRCQAPERHGQRETNELLRQNPAGAPPLDYWQIPTQPFSGVSRGDTLYRASRDCPEHSLQAIRQRLHTAPDGELRESLLRNSRRTDLDPGAKQQLARFAKSDLDSKTSRHAMQDWIDQSIRSEQTTGSNGASRTPATPDHSDRVPGRQDVDARTAGRTSSTPTASTTPDQTPDSPHPDCTPTATPHSTASNRTGHAPSTSPSDTPSAESPDRTAGTSTSPEWSSPHPDMPASSTAEACPTADDLGTGDRIVRSSSRRCSCQQFTESTSHYATWPEQLCVIPIKSMVPERVCQTCGQPSRRIVGNPEYRRNDSTRVPARLTKLDGHRPAAGVNQHVRDDGANTSVTRITATLGWSDCGHDNYRRGIVLDCFAGSGTTLAVSERLGRDSIGIDLDQRNAQLAQDRVAHAGTLTTTTPTGVTVTVGQGSLLDGIT